MHICKVMVSLSTDVQIKNLLKLSSIPFVLIESGIVILLISKFRHDIQMVDGCVCGGRSVSMFVHIRKHVNVGKMYIGNKYL